MATKKKPARRAKRTFPKISPRAFEHPLDRTALTALQKVKGFDWLVRKFLSAIGERRLRLFFLASAVRVNERQLPRVKKLFDEACRRLDIAEPPELFITQTFVVNAAAIGVDKPFIILTSPLCDLLDDEELQCVMGHELGHVMCGHALYTTLLILLLRIWYFFLGIPGGAYAALAILLALLEWSRKAELTSDRAGLLVSQDLEVSHRVDMKLAGGKAAGEMSVAEFKKQAEEYQAGGDLLDGVLKLVLVMRETHPFPVLRVAELQKWVDSGEYQKILDGEYERRDEEAKSSWLDSVKATAASYKESWDGAKDPLVSTLRDLGGGAASAATELFDAIKGFAGGRKGDDEVPPRR
jgi:Zn-dependent protease with chaperone function